MGQTHGGWGTGSAAEESAHLCLSHTGRLATPGGCVGRKREDLASGLSEEQDRRYERSEASLTRETLFIPPVHLQGKWAGLRLASPTVKGQGQTG